MDNQRFILFIALSLIIVMLWGAWEKEQQAQAPAPAATTSAPPAPSGGPVPSAPAAGTAPAAQAAPAIRSQQLEQGQRVVVTTDLLRAEIDTVGGDLRVLDLLAYPETLGEKKPFRLLDDQGKDSFVAQSGLLARDAALPNHNSRYTSESLRYALHDGLNELEVRLNWAGADGLRVTKVYVFRRNDYKVDVRFEVSNNGRAARDVYQYAQLRRHYIDPGTSLTALPTYTGGVIYTNEKKYEKIDFDSMLKKKLERDADGGWVAMIQHYFVGAWLPAAATKLQYFSDTAEGRNFIIGYKSLAPVAIAPGQKAALTTSLYAGPKEQHRLDKAAPGLQLTVDYGWLDLIASPLFWIMEWLYRLVGNWGWAIILLTILIKLAFYPLSVASYRSMAHMKKVQPKLQALKERYGDDKQKMQQAMMEIYKTEKINPLGGCLPILVQIPVFIALYWVLLESVELRQAPWALWIKDLAAPDPYFVLPLVMGASMLAQQWLNPQPLDDMQKKIMYALPVIFTFMFLWFPSGLVLYWVVQNVLSIAQQWQINRAVEGEKK
jgi:YidC/Oxa1 family membrane protein insertase